MRKSLVYVVALWIVACGGGSNNGGTGAGATAGAGASSPAGTGGGISGAGTGGSSVSGPGAGAGAGSGPGPTSGAGAGGTCLASGLLNSLGSSHILAGAAMDDPTAASAPFDVRYQYIAGGLFDVSPCASCASNCTSNGVSCANSGPGCAWWGCWQWDQDPPGAFARSFISTDQTDAEIPMFSYYQEYQSSGATEGQGEVDAATNVAFMTRYLDDWRFLVQQVGSNVALLQIEPDFWGYVEQANQDPHATPAAVSSANPTDCANAEDSMAGLGRCMIKMVRTYAPNAKVGLHGSGWGTNIDVLGNSDPSLDVVGEANKLGDFLVACGADQGDYVVVDALDRDAGYYQSLGQNRWWDATNATLPNFHQAFAWAKAVAERVGKPIVWWQLPVGNMSLPDVSGQWKDNRVDYFFAHTDELAASHVAGFFFGAGAGGQTDPSTDGGNLVSKVQAYRSAGGQAPCP